jgi:hypothetical protein
MTTKIAYLEAGPLVDYWVAMAARYDPVYQADSAEGPRMCISKCHDDKGEVVPVPLRAFRPSTNWGDGGAFIECEHIDLVHDFGRWMGRHSRRDDYSRSHVSSLVAVIRAYLMWEYGDEVPRRDSRLAGSARTWQVSAKPAPRTI